MLYTPRWLTPMGGLYKPRKDKYRIVADATRPSAACKLRPDSHGEALVVVLQVQVVVPEIQQIKRPNKIYLSDLIFWSADRVSLPGP